MSRIFCLLLSIIIAGKLTASHPAYPPLNDDLSTAQTKVKIEAIEPASLESASLRIIKYPLDQPVKPADDSGLGVPKPQVPSVPATKPADDSNISVLKPQVPPLVLEDVLDDLSASTGDDTDSEDDTDLDEEIKPKKEKLPLSTLSTLCVTAKNICFWPFRCLSWTCSTAKNICFWPFRCLGRLYNFCCGYEDLNDKKTN